MKKAQKKIINSRPLFYGFLTLLLSLTVANFLFSGSVAISLLCILCLLILVGICVYQRNWKIFLFLICVFLFGIGWFYVGLSTFSTKEYSGTCEVSGRISDSLQQSTYGDRWKLVLKDVKINGEETKNMSLIIENDDNMEFSIGDKITFSQEVNNTRLFELSTFSVYNFRNNCAYTCTVSSSEVSVVGNYVSFDEKLRMKVKSLLYSSMGEENGAIGYAVLFGDKTDVYDETYEAYRVSGIIHLLTVSGLHISFLVAMLGFFLKKLHVKGLTNFVICFVFLFIYAYLCGFSPSVVRAGVMGLVCVGATMVGKRYDNLNSLGLAGFLILICSPLSALDLGFLMSFFCVMGIFVISPILSKYLSKIMPKGLADAMSISIATQIGILPFMADMFGTLNFLSVFANLIVIPFFGILYPFLFVVTMICCILPFMSFLLHLCSLGFDFITFVAKFFASTSLALDLSPFDQFVVACVFVACFAISKFLMTKKRVKAIACAILVCVLSVDVVCGSLSKKNETTISYCCSYSNETILLTNKSGGAVLVDLAYDSFTKKLLNKNQIDNVSSVFLLQNTKLKSDVYKIAGAGNVFRTGTLQGYEDERKCEFDERGMVLGFEYVFKSYEKKLLGLEISFDGLKIFILKNSSFDEIPVEEIQKECYDIIVLGQQSQFAKQFSSQTTIITQERDENVDFSYDKDGNISFKFENNNLERRQLD